ncbi:hypothetical protein [Congregibacter litoralis]|uniref:SoxXA-binding protein SoxK n=1 Tax=Congregibacter litoralis KT71 TaxID=314285 RepID=A4A7K2_9GAMM|nr:hypothetical protein [Congregibacter litoralis]EAQ98271.2 SoxXA-binding protein SoxK [Congregibacter litoralis KT71]
MNKTIHTVIRQGLLVPLLLSPAVVLGDPVETLARAMDIHQQALAEEHGWAVTEPLMEEARAALEAGDPEQAQMLADRALLVAEQSLKQAQSEKTAWKTRVVGR